MPNVFLEAMCYSYLRRGRLRKVEEELKGVSSENIEICLRYDTGNPDGGLEGGPLMLLATHRGSNIQLEGPVFMPAVKSVLKVIKNVFY